jgi:hypothetical protein
LKPLVPQLNILLIEGASAKGLPKIFVPSPNNSIMPIWVKGNSDPL